MGRTAVKRAPRCFLTTQSRDGCRRVAVNDTLVHIFREEYSTLGSNVWHLKGRQEW